MMSTSVREQQLVKLYFVIPDGKTIEEVNADMVMAFESTKDHFDSDDIQTWLTEEDCLALKTDDLNKKHVFIFEKFEGRGFEYIKSLCTILIGPRALISCFLDNDSIPLGNNPVFTTAMRNITVCPSGLQLDEKSQIKQMILNMGGFYLDSLNGACTHLVSNTVKSNKYEKASSLNLKIMHPDWVKDVWEKSQNENITATSPVFDKHKLPIFYGLTFTATGLTTDEKNQIQTLIQQNGGKYMGAFKSEVVDMLILKQNNTNSAKYKAAVRFKKDCVTPNWISDSVESGYSLPLSEYEVKGMKFSTPTKVDGHINSADFNPDCTQLSEISHNDSKAYHCTINESISSFASGSTTMRSTRSKPQPSVPTYREMLASINLSLTKKAGTFLDGCSIYLSGFNAEDKDKLYKILNRGGATRYDEINEKISHVLIGEKDHHDLRLIKSQNISSCLVTLEWLVKSIELKSPAAEEDYRFLANFKDIELKEPEAPSPASKKNLESMSSTFKRPPIPKFNLDAPKTVARPSTSSKPDGDDVLMQYMQKNTSVRLPETTTKSDSQESITQSSEMDSEITDFLDCKTFFIYGFDEEDSAQLVQDCESRGGQIVDDNYRDVADYILLPSFFHDDPNYRIKGKEIVNDIWIENVFYEKEFLPIEYFYKPIIYGRGSPMFLQNEVVVLSTYSTSERQFLGEVAKGLGATVYEKYPKKMNPILICKETSGSKYEAAVKWDLPVLRAEWLLECAQQKRRVDETKFLVGCAKCSAKNILDKVETVAKDGCLPSFSTDDVDDIDSIILPQQHQKSVDTIQQKENQNASVDLDQMSQEEIHKFTQEFMERCDRLEKQPEARLDDVFMSPALPKHRRLSELNPITPEVSSNVRKSASTPTDYKPMTDEQIVMTFDTPLRDTLRKVLKEAEEEEKNITPRTRRKRELLATPKAGGSSDSPKTPQLPDCITKPVTPYGFDPDASPDNHLYHKRKLKILDSFYVSRPKKERRKSTPLSEIKMRFWREKLGDEYVDSVQKLCYKPMQDDDSTEEDESNIPCTSTTSSFNDINDSRSSTKIEEVSTKKSNQNLLTDAENLQRLSDLIVKNREAEKRPSYNLENNPPPDSEIPRFDSEMMNTNTEDVVVGWRDPTEFYTSRRFKNKGKIQYIGTPKFGFSSTDEEIRILLSEKIKNLKGAVTDVQNLYDPTCTHFLTTKPNRGEKILCGIAAGKWILSTKYIEESSEAGVFLDEEFYEWGNPKANILPVLETEDQPTANAAYQWRYKISTDASKRTGAFTGFRVLLVCPKKEQFIRLLRAGGGVVIDCEPPFVDSDDAMTATHCFVDTRKTKLQKRDHKALAETGILVMSIMYLNTYLTSDAPNQKQYLLEVSG